MTIKTIETTPEAEFFKLSNKYGQIRVHIFKNKNNIFKLEDLIGDDQNLIVDDFLEYELCNFEAYAQFENFFLFTQENIGKGFGKEIIMKALSFVKEKNIPFVYLRASPVFDMVELSYLIDFYKKFGFIELSENKKTAFFVKKVN